MTFKLNYIGKLYKEHLSIISKQHYVFDDKNVTGNTPSNLILKKCSSKGLCVFAKLTSLMESPFVINNKRIILTTTEISDRICDGKIISGRMVKRQIDFFKEAIPNLFKLNSYKNKSYIEINLPNNQSGFINIFGLQDQENEFIKDTTVDILLSCLLDKAAFNFRCGYEFFVEPSQLKNLKTELNLTEKTIISTIEKLKDLEVIKVNSLKNENELESKNDLLKSEIRFDFQIFNQLKEFLNLSQTEKCLEIKKKREAKIPVQKVSENEIHQSKKQKESSKDFANPVLNSSSENKNANNNFTPRVKTDEEIIEEGNKAIALLNAMFKKDPPDKEQRYYLRNNFPTREGYFPTGTTNCLEKNGHPVGKKWLSLQEKSSHVSEKNWSSI